MEGEKKMKKQISLKDTEMLEIIHNTIMNDKWLIYKRCLLEGHRYGIEGIDKELLNNLSNILNDK